ncbi:MAG: endolytic transglycosylase MltG [Candidatus Levyibacteriota bacterium]|nr:MAG: endolytic transglycosylase MltG [Candidatus Levybacteria bacterium]
MKRIAVLFGIIFFLLISLSIWWYNGIQPIDKNNNTKTIFVIEKGSGIREIANKLKKENLIKDPVLFFLVVKKQGIDGKIQAGDFRLSPSMTMYEIADNLTHGTLDVWITIPEGKRAEEIADILQEKIPSFDQSWRLQLVKHEGYLFPDTYLVPKDADINLIIALMTKNFDNKFSQIKTAGKIKNDIVTIASLVEREAKHQQDRPLVASVITNRLRIGMKLDIDATIQYTLGYQRNEKTWWKKALTREDINFNSSYNTYKNPGLPPTPISNPGLAALQAAANPAKTNYFYYISDKKGVNHYAATIEDHNANIRKYDL